MKRSIWLSAAVLFFAVTTGQISSAQSTSGQGYFFGPGVPTVLGASQGETLIGTGNTVYLWQFVLTTSWTIRTATYITYNSLPYPGYPLGFGIYSYAGTKLLDVYFDTTATAGGTPVTQTFTGVTLAAGVYYFAQAQPASGIAGPTLLLNGGGSVTAAQMLAFLNAPAAVLSGSPITGTAANGMSGGVLPTSLGTISPLTDTGVQPASVLFTP
jgi:hypothetical protein